MLPIQVLLALISLSYIVFHLNFCLTLLHLSDALSVFPLNLPHLPQLCRVADLGSRNCPSHLFFYCLTQCPEHRRCQEGGWKNHELTFSESSLDTSLEASPQQSRWEKRRKRRLSPPFSVEEEVSLQYQSCWITVYNTSRHILA